jgi:hypothetical protein
MKALIGAILGSLLLSGCGYQGWIRYECQEYENWSNPDCQPPRCEVVGTCTKDLIPEEIYEPFKP